MVTSTKLQGVRGDNGWKDVLDVLPVRTINIGVAAFLDGPAPVCRRKGELWLILAKKLDCICMIRSLCSPERSVLVDFDSSFHSFVRPCFSVENLEKRGLFMSWTIKDFSALAMAEC